VVDLRRLPLDEIAPGTVVGESSAQGWSHLMLIATPRIGVGDVNAIPRTALKYSSLCHFTILANVRDVGKGDDHAFALDRVAIGCAIPIEEKQVVVTSSQTFNGEVGFIGRRILEENEAILRTDFRQVVRTPTMLVFDAEGFVLYNKKHARMLIRHAIVVSPRDGKLSTFIWLMGSDGKGGNALAERSLQRIAPGFHEDRVLSVDANKFTLGIPSYDAFALAHIPRGTAVEPTPTLARLAVTSRFTPESASSLETELQARNAPLLDAAVAPTNRRR